jgi:NADH:ubiquinone oxidoreductase subunit F (NADH-binding)/NADH:ubiquinone oxidoreductase subunit E
LIVFIYQATDYKYCLISYLMIPDFKTKALKVKIMTITKDTVVWKSGSGKGRKNPRGRQVQTPALNEIKELLGTTPRNRDLLIEFLHLIQDKFGLISCHHISALAEEMKLAQAEIYEVATFYAHFDVIKEGDSTPAPTTVRVCDSLSCELNGAQALLKSLQTTLDPSKIRVVRAPCMGRCDTAPTLEIGHNHIDKATVEKVKTAISKKDFHATIPSYENFSDYKKSGGYSTYLNCNQGKETVENIEAKLIDSGLRGLGGAGFPSGKKWSIVRNNKGPRYLAVNGDEGEPGTFKDRFYLERTPHLFLEGMLIAAWAVKAEKIFIYMRDEYPAVLSILKTELQVLEEQGIIDKGYVDLRRGAGAYICGEESAMIESIEGKRGLPRHRPPYVAQSGIFNRPTLVHNVETLYWVTKICREGPEILNKIEKNGRKGLRSYSVSGRVSNPGVYLLPAGSTISDVIKAAGGMLQGHSFTAYQPGGPSSGLLPASIDDVPLDFDTLQELGTFIGSAAVIVLSDKDKARDAAMNMLRFFEDESCGQCTPCRVGCEKAVKLMGEETWDKELLIDLCETMVDASICGLGQAAPNAILSTLKFFSKEV